MDCEQVGCDRPAYAKDNCERHYRQLLRHGQVSPGRVAAACAVEPCDRKAVTRGWCHGHYIRWNRSGDVRADVPLVRPVVDTCTVKGCGRGATSTLLCRTHYNRWKRYGDPMAGGPIRVLAGGGCLSHGYWWMPVPAEERHLVPVGRAQEFEHRLVMARSLNRPLTADEVVHHRNGDRVDNGLENLELWTIAQPKGQRVEDKVRYAREILARYDDQVVAAMGWDLDPDTGHPLAAGERRTS